METVTNGSLHYIKDEDVKLIIAKYGYSSDEVCIDNFVTHNACNNMLGFLADYWRLKVNIILKNGHKETLSFFIKAVSRTNAAKAVMVRELKLFQKETFFYNVLKDRMEVSGLKPWCARFITSLDEAIVLEDLSALQYRSRDKFLRFDIHHTLQALETLARFHASSIILEEKKTKILGRPYVIQEEYEQFLDRGGYKEDDTWFQQCRVGALEALKTFSKHSANEDNIKLIESRWNKVWCSALSLSDFSPKHRNVICHRDLWNNNILFRYKKDRDGLIPDDCVLVDFQAVRCQPPAGDVMLLLYSNLDSKLREENMQLFLNHYYIELKLCLASSDLDFEDIIPKAQFLESAEEQRLWANIVNACLLPLFWINDDLTTEIFTDAAQFNDILTNDKGAFIKKMMETNQDYKEKVTEMLDEIVERYCLKDCD
ncbi:uncharacterized protein LOC114360693 [Ostrinia furnacalis]|uniref:uncharacterized protein LOC114360693 n=1 Tax=Ostrinia furnacalis TaxID=93504 RepID=UPI0010409A7B|nr:uncharacterized protein LOC114360693 [Ostrinia furnacalis]